MSILQIGICTNMSNYQADWLIFERKRLGLTRKTLSDHLSVADKTIQRWEADTPIPSDKLAAMIGLGFDVLYILTGQRSSNALPTDEVLILEKYRQASPEIKNKMLMLLLSGETTNGVVNSPVNSGKGNQYNGTNQTINNAAPTKSKDINGDVSIKAKGKRAQAAFNIKNE